MECKEMKRAGRVVVFTLFFIGFSFSAVPAESFKSEFAGELPSIKEVYLKLFSGLIENASEDQLRVLIEERLTQDEKIVLRKFLGDEGVKEIRARASSAPEKEALLDPLDKGLADKDTDLEFKQAFPLIVAKSINVLDVDQLDRQYRSLDDREMGTLSMFLDLDGLAVMFGDIPCAKAEVIMRNSPDWLLIEMGKKKLATMNTYESIVYKREIVDGEQQDTEKMLLKFRHKPWALYMKWLDGPFKGRECLFNELVSTEDVRVRESGLLGIVAVDIPLTSSLARRGSNHVPTEIGIFYLIGMIEKDYRKASQAGDLTRINHGIQDLDGHKVFVMESRLQRDPGKGYYCYRMMHYIDYQRSLLIKAEIFNFQDQMSEMYYYTEIKMNPPYTDADFDSENPEYDL